MTLLDFSNCPSGYRDYSGSDTKRSIEYNGEKYMLKMPEVREKKLDIQTSHVNNVFSEYIGSHVIATLGLPVHETFLGIYNGEPAVACKDFTGNGYRLQEFSWMMRSVYHATEVGRIPTYNQLYDTMEKNNLLSPIKQEAIARYWDTFIADSLIGNFDRHKGNWGYLVNEDSKDVKLAPIYDCGSCLYPSLSEAGMITVLNDKKAIEDRMYVFPKAALNMSSNIKKEQKAEYYAFPASGIDEYCTEAFIRIYPRINLDAIDYVIDSTPLLSDTRINFYKSMLHYRKELILDKIYEALKEKDINFKQKIVNSSYAYESSKLEENLAKKGIKPNDLEYATEMSKLKYDCQKRFGESLISRNELNNSTRKTDLR